MASETNKKILTLIKWLKEQYINNSDDCYVSAWNDAIRQAISKAKEILKQ